MSARRRSRSRSGRGGGAPQANQSGSQNKPRSGAGPGAPGGRGAKRHKGGQQGGKPSGGNRKRSGRRSRKPGTDTGIDFWGDTAKLPKSHPDIRITDDPSAVPRSLGTPPLPGHEAIAGHYFTAVYDRAVATAGALAAAGGLIDPTALLEDDRAP